MKYFDSHAHYYDERFSEELEMGVDDLIDTLLKENVYPMDEYQPHSTYFRAF